MSYYIFSLVQKPPEYLGIKENYYQSHLYVGEKGYMCTEKEERSFQTNKIQPSYKE